MSSLSDAVLQKMRDNASDEIERIENERLVLLQSIDQIGSQQNAILAPVRQADEVYDQAEKDFREALRHVRKQRIRSAVAKGTDKEADETAALEGLLADKDAIQTTLQDAKQQKQDAQALLSDLAALREQEGTIRDQLADLAAAREEALIVRDELDQKIAISQQQKGF